MPNSGIGASCSANTRLPCPRLIKFIPSTGIGESLHRSTVSGIFSILDFNGLDSHLRST